VSLPELMTYAEVKALFRWKDNSTIRDYVAKGLLQRVKIGNNTKCHRITGESCQSLLDHIKRVNADADYLVRARMQTARERKGLSADKSGEVLLDPQEIIRRYNEGRKSPEPVDDYQPPAQPVRRALGFVRVRGL
jgi:hypothetical protein